MNNLRKIIKIIDAAYPDGMIGLYHKEPERLHGDSLAEFIEREVRENFDENLSLKDQLEEAHRVMITARNELSSVVDALEKAMDIRVLEDGKYAFGPIEIVVSERGTKIEITDSSNPRARAVYWKCRGEDCNGWIHEDEVNWATPDGKLNTDTGDPYCDGCLPEEKE